MKPIKEPQDIDLMIQSSQWSDKDTSEFRMLMCRIKAKKPQKRVIATRREMVSALF